MPLSVQFRYSCTPVIWVPTRLPNQKHTKQKSASVDSYHPKIALCSLCSLGWLFRLATSPLVPRGPFPAWHSSAEGNPSHPGVIYSWFAWPARVAKFNLLPWHARKRSKNKTGLCCLHFESTVSGAELQEISPGTVQTREKMLFPVKCLNSIDYPTLVPIQTHVSPSHTILSGQVNVTAWHAVANTFAKEASNKAE